MTDEELRSARLIEAKRRWIEDETPRREVAHLADLYEVGWHPPEPVDLDQPYRPVAIHYPASDTLEFVNRDVPTVSRPAQGCLDVLVTMDTGEPVGWRIYGWSRISPDRPDADTSARQPSPREENIPPAGEDKP